MNIIRFPGTRRPAGSSVTTPDVKPVDELRTLFQRPAARVPAAPEPPPAPTELPLLQILARGRKALKKLAGFIGESQRKTVLTCLKGEEGQWFMEKMEELAERVATMPATHENHDGTAHLHYFMGNYDAYILEKDTGAEDDTPEQFQSQAYGWARFAHMPECAEHGYISLPEILANGAELDFHFTPKPLAEAIKRFDPYPDPEPPGESRERNIDPVPPPPDNAPAEPEPGKLHIKIHRGEGLVEECMHPHHYGDFATAWECMKALGHTAPKDGCYDKTDVVVTFPDGQFWSYRYDLTHGGSDSLDGKDMTENLRFRIGIYAGRINPEWMEREGRRSEFMENPAPDAVAILDAWEHLITLEPPTAAAEPDTPNTLATLQQDYLAKESAKPGDGWRVGAVLVETWGYEQTNKDFYQIVQRGGTFLTLIPLNAVRTRHKDPGGTDAMRGTSMPGCPPENAATFRRKLDLTAHRPIAKGKHGFLELWNGEPQHWTDYA